MRTSTTHTLARRFLIASLGLLALSALLSPESPVGERAAAAQAAPACVLRGAPVMAKTAEVWSAASGGERIAHFTGQPMAMAVTLASSGRAGLRTGTGTRGFRLEGFIEPRQVPAFTTRNVPVAAGHVWIAGGRPVRVEGGPSGQAVIEIAARSPLEQTVRAGATCDDVALDRPSWKPTPLPGDGRGYLVKKAPLELRGEAGGPVVFTLSSASIAGSLLLWSTEKTASEVRVRYSGDIVLDAWAPAGALEAQKEGEILDALAPGSSSITQPRLMLQGSPTTVKVSREVTVRAHANDAAGAIGAIEPEGEVMIIETVLGWSNVLPTSLAVMAPENGGFWVKTAELGTTPGSPPSPLRSRPGPGRGADRHRARTAVPSPPR